jgi:N-acetylmuramoyl-L-alanine amidase
MNRKAKWFLITVYTVVLSIVFIASVAGSKLITVVSEKDPPNWNHCIIIDAGHGGVDGGASSCTGVLESNINLEIALRLNDLLHLLGIDTLMIRTTDISVYTEGESIAAKKVSDLKNRVRIINETKNGILVSIHQNHFTDSRYNGAQVFYANSTNSAFLAKSLQSVFVQSLNPSSKRLAKKAEGVYLMQNIHCPGILVECGFLSNTEEEVKLRSASYQKKLCSAIAATLSVYIHDELLA